MAVVRTQQSAVRTGYRQAVDKQNRRTSDAMLHSDQGFQYTSQAYHKRLEGFGIGAKGSHSCKANLPG
ncbi:hypothetical protein [Paenibacillus sp. NPDC057934]|uniref:hypothetical protein n=1 Tax=Paenibacillus sp. NPDC057934 TaxID=3346282 RepID=UPI0036DD5752